MLRSDMAEKRQGSAELEDVDQATFVRFLEWLYRGYYHAALPIQTTAVAMPTQDSDNLDVDHDNFAPQSSLAPRELLSGSNNSWESALTEVDSVDAERSYLSVRKYQVLSKKQRKRRMIENTSSDAVHLAPSQDVKQAFAQRKNAVRQTVKSLPQPRRNQGEHEDYTEVFLCHVYLYVFADKYDIQPLKILALEELHATLNVFTLYSERVKDVVTLLQYVYANAPEQANETEDLRTLMRQYVECEIDTFLEDDGLGDRLVGCEGAILGDIFKIMRKRLATAYPVSQWRS